MRFFSPCTSNSPTVRASHTNVRTLNGGLWGPETQTDVLVPSPATLSDSVALALGLCVREDVRLLLERALALDSQFGGHDCGVGQSIVEGSVGEGVAAASVVGREVEGVKSRCALLSKIGLGVDGGRDFPRRPRASGRQMSRPIGLSVVYVCFESARTATTTSSTSNLHTHQHPLRGVACTYTHNGGHRRQGESCAADFERPFAAETLIAIAQTVWQERKKQEHWTWITRGTGASKD